VVGIQWIGNHNKEPNICLPKELPSPADYTKPSWKITYLPLNTQLINSSKCIYICKPYRDVKYNVVNFSELNISLSNKSKIYDNGGFYTYLNS